MNKHYFYSRKGGVGTTTTAAAFAVLLAETGSVLFVDSSTGADAHAVFGMSSNPHDVRETANNLWFYYGDVNDIDTSGYDNVVIDLGVLRPIDLLPTDGTTYMVTKNCYLALKACLGQKPNVAIIVMEEGRALRFEDAAATLDSAVGVTKVPYDPSIARAVDAGLLAARVPQVLRRGLGAPKTVAL